MSFRHIWHICQKNKDVGDVMVQKKYVFYKGTVKLFFVELQHRNLTAKNWLYIFYSFVTAHCKKLALYLLQFCHGALQKIQFPLAILLVSGLSEVNELALL